MTRLANSKDRAQMTANTALSLSLIVVLKELIDLGPVGNKYYYVNISLISISLSIATTGNTTPTGTKENDIFSLLKMTNLIWKQILVDLLNRFYIIKKNYNWIVHRKHTKSRKKAKVWQISCNFFQKCAKYFNCTLLLLTIATKIGLKNLDLS